MIKKIIRSFVEFLLALVIFFLLIKYLPFGGKNFSNTTSTKTSVEIYEKQKIEEKKKTDVDGILEMLEESLSNSSNQSSEKITKNHFSDGISINNQNNQKNQENNIENAARRMIITNTRIPVLVQTNTDNIEEKSGKRSSCSVPWGNEQIPDGHYIIAYKEKVANKDNVCIGELRKCDNGQLLGGYVYPNCTYTIDGINDGKEIIPGAMQTKHNLFTFIKNQEIPYEYIQPPRYTYPNMPKKSYMYDVRGNRIIVMENKGNTTRNNARNTRIPTKLTDLRIPKAVVHKSCTSPWGEKVAHGDYILAYKQPFAENSSEVCLFEKRPCIDGKLYGSWLYPTCTDIIQEQREQETNLPLPSTPSTRQKCSTCTIEEKKCTRRGRPLDQNGRCCPGLEAISTSGGRICGKNGKISCETNEDCPGEVCSAGMCIPK